MTSEERIARAVWKAERYCSFEKAVSIVAMRRRDLQIADVRRMALASPEEVAAPREP